MAESTVEKGKKGEEDLNEWLKAAGLGCFAIYQSPETFADLFKNEVKRPDFLVLLDSIGLIAVDAKNYKPFNDKCYTLKCVTELDRSLRFEQLFRLPVWYAFRSDDGGHVVWYWISAVKAQAIGTERKNKDTGESFLVFPMSECACLKTPDDLGKLLIQRLPLPRGKRVSSV